MRPGSASPRRRAFTLVELLIAAALAGLFASVISVVLVSSTTEATGAVARAQADEQSRSALNLLSRYLRGARMPGVCLDPVGSTSAVACKAIGEGVPDPSAPTSRVIPKAFLAAGPESMQFYATTSGGLGSSTALTPPDRVAVRSSTISGTSSRKLLVFEVEKASGDYLSPTYAPKSALTIGEVDATGVASWQVFRYFDSSGTELSPVSGGCSANPVSSGLSCTDLPKVAYVQATPTFSWEGGGQSGSVSPKLFVALPSRLYAAGGT